MSAKRREEKKKSVSKVPNLPYHSDICALANNFKELNATDVCLIHTLRAGMAARNKTNWRNLETLGHEMGCWSSTVERSISKLSKMNIIEINKRGKKGGGYAGNEYKIIYPWKPISLKFGEINSLKIRETCPSNRGKLIPSNRGTNILIVPNGTIIHQSNKSKANDENLDFDFSSISDHGKGETISKNFEPEVKKDLRWQNTETIPAKIEKEKLDTNSHSTLTEFQKNRKKGNREDIILRWLEGKGQTFACHLLEEAENRMRNVNDIRKHYPYRLKILEDIQKNPDKNKEFYDGFNHWQSIINRRSAKTLNSSRLPEKRERQKFEVNSIEFDKQMQTGFYD